MRIFAYLLIALTCFTPASAMGEESNSLSLFMPAILAAAKKNNTEVSCGNIAGCYYGLNSDSISGDTQIKININADCSFTGVTQNLVKISGNITRREGNSLSGRGTAEGGFENIELSITCNVTNGILSCNYNSDGNGYVGWISNGEQGGCKANNRFLTETLAGFWVFKYSIGSSPYSDQYSLDQSTVSLVAGTTDTFAIYGTNQYNSSVVAGYDPPSGIYTLYEPGTIIDQLFTFYFTGLNSVAGCYQLYSHSGGYWSNCYQMTGTRY